MSDIAITPANVATSTQASINKQYTYGATITAGEAVYLNSANQWVLLAAGTASGNGPADLRGISVNGGSLNQPASVCTFDPSFTLGGTVVNGTPYYTSGNAGAITATTPTTAGYPCFLGFGISTTKIALGIGSSANVTGVVI